MTWSDFLVFSSESSKFVIQSGDGLKKMMHISVLPNAHIFVYIVFKDNKRLLKRVMISERRHKCVREEKEGKKRGWGVGEKRLQVCIRWINAAGVVCALS